MAEPGKYDKITCADFMRGSSYKTIYGKGEKALQDYIRQQHQTVSLPAEALSDLQIQNGRTTARHHIPLRILPKKPDPNGL